MRTDGGHLRAAIALASLGALYAVRSKLKIR